MRRSAGSDQQQVKPMQKIILSLLALSMLAVPAQAAVCAASVCVDWTSTPDDTSVKASAPLVYVVAEKTDVNGNHYTLFQVFVGGMYVVTFYHNDDTGQFPDGFTCYGVANGMIPGVGACQWGFP